MKSGVLGVGICVLLLLACGDDDSEVANLVARCQQESAEDACEVFRLVNVERANAGLTLYQYDEDLAAAAQAHANDQVAQGYFSHESQDGRSFADRVGETAYAGWAAAENIAQGQRDAEEVMSSWMNSAGHRNNILSSSSTDIGVGLQKNTWVQVFGRR